MPMSSVKIAICMAPIEETSALAHMPVAGDLARIIEVVEHTKLLGELVLIGCDCAAIHR